VQRLGCHDGIVFGHHACVSVIVLFFIEGETVRLGLADFLWGVHPMDNGPKFAVKQAILPVDSSTKNLYLTWSLGSKSLARCQTLRHCLDQAARSADSRRKCQCPFFDP